MRTLWSAVACAAGCALLLFGCREYPGRPLTWSSTTMLEFDIGPTGTELFTYSFANAYQAPPGQVRMSGLLKGDASQKAVLPTELDFKLTQLRYPLYDVTATYEFDVPVKKNGRFKFKEDFPGLTFGQFDGLRVDLAPKDGMLKTNSMFAMTYTYVSH